MYNIYVKEVLILIIITGDQSRVEDWSSGFESKSVEYEIIQNLQNSPTKFKYKSKEELLFEINLRKSITKAAIDLNNSKFKFEVFKNTRCNPKYWKRTSGGGFLQRRSVKSSDAIKNIYDESHLYGTECATAIVIVYLKAMVDILPEKLFLKLFEDIYLYSWMHLDEDLGIRDYTNPEVYLPGDCRYFNNPSFNRQTPEWRGENVIYVGNQRYYGHGIGIRNANEIIRMLNSKRMFRSRESSYLMNSAKRPNFSYLYRQYSSYNQ